MRRSIISVVVVFVASIAAFVGVLATDTSPQLGLDLQGGLSVVLAPTDEQGDLGDRLDKAVDIVRSRVDALGVAEPEIARQGDTIVVDLPGVREQERARDLIGTTAELQFRPVQNLVPVPEGTDVEDLLGQLNQPVPDPGAEVPPAGAPPAEAPGAEVPPTEAPAPGDGGGGGDEGALGRQDTDTTEPADGSDATTTTAGDAAETTTTTTPELVGAGQEFDAGEPIVAVGRDEGFLYQLGPAELTGEVVSGADARFVGGSWAVDVTFTGEGSQAWDDMASRYFGQQVAIVLDGVVQSAPQINAAEFGGEAQITGDFSEGEAKDLALVLDFGALPVELEEISVQEVSPSLGRDQLDAGIFAGILGLALVAVYIVLYYRLLGLVVWMSLAVTGAAIYAIVAFLGEQISLTLTLAGVVGLIVSIGVAVDSNIVYFERIKEEMRTGRTLRSSADRGFRQAFRTIVAADVVTLLGAGLLWWLAIGSVRGFAFYLGLATALDLVISYFFMHPLVRVLGRSRRLGESALLRLPGSTPPAAPEGATP